MPISYKGKNVREILELKDEAELFALGLSSLEEKAKEAEPDESVEPVVDSEGSEEKDKEPELKTSEDFVKNFGVVVVTNKPSVLKTLEFTFNKLTPDEVMELKSIELLIAKGVPEGYRPSSRTIAMNPNLDSDGMLKAIRENLKISHWKDTFAEVSKARQQLNELNALGSPKVHINLDQRGVRTEQFLDAREGVEEIIKLLKENIEEPVTIDFSNNIIGTWDEDRRHLGLTFKESLDENIEFIKTTLAGEFEETEAFAEIDPEPKKEPAESKERKELSAEAKAAVERLQSISDKFVFIDWENIPSEIIVKHERKLDYILTLVESKVEPGQVIKLRESPGVAVEEGKKAIYLGYESSLNNNADILFRYITKESVQALQDKIKASKALSESPAETPIEDGGEKEELPSTVEKDEAVKVVNNTEAFGPEITLEEKKNRATEIKNKLEKKYFTSDSGMMVDWSGVSEEKILQSNGEELEKLFITISINKPESEDVLIVSFTNEKSSLKGDQLLLNLDTADRSEIVKLFENAQSENIESTETTEEARERSKKEAIEKYIKLCSLEGRNFDYNNLGFMDFGLNDTDPGRVIKGQKNTAAYFAYPVRNTAGNSEYWVVPNPKVATKRSLYPAIGQNKKPKKSSVDSPVFIRASKGDSFEVVK